MGGRGSSSGKAMSARKGKIIGTGGTGIADLLKAKSQGAFEVDWYSHSVDNPAVSVAIRNITATPQMIEEIIVNTIKPGESIQDAVKKIQDSNIAFNIEIPKYKGTDKQVRYAQNLAEAYAISVAITIASRWYYPDSRKKIKQALESKNIKFSGNEYAKYMMQTSRTLKAVQSMRNAADVIALLKDKVNPNNRAYNNAPQGFEMRKAIKF